MSLKTYSLLFFSFLFLFSLNSFSFVENATHGYSNCMTCHYAPSGGDLLNDYGRSLSAELMSTWTKEGAEQPLGGLIKNTKWAKFGGDLRTIQTYVNTPLAENRSLFLMQNNVEIGLKHKKLMLIGTLGTLQGRSGTPDQGEFLSERHYLMYSFNERSHLRAGKFRINYGINDPNHNRPIKNRLGFGARSEKYNLEYSRFFDKGDVFVNYSFGRIDRTRDNNDERSVMARATHYLNGSSKLGLNFLYGETPTSDRSLVGIFGISPTTEKTYIMYELDYENEKNQSQKTESLLLNLRYGYEFFKGFRGYAMYDFQKTISQSQRLTAPGLGFQWFPFPHFELQVEYQSLKNRGAKANDVGFILAHIYY